MIPSKAGVLFPLFSLETLVVAVLRGIRLMCFLIVVLLGIASARVNKRAREAAINGRHTVQGCVDLVLWRYYLLRQRRDFTARNCRGPGLASVARYVATRHSDFIKRYSVDLCLRVGTRSIFFGPCEIELWHTIRDMYSANLVQRDAKHVLSHKRFKHFDVRLQGGLKTS